MVQREDTIQVLINDSMGSDMQQHYRKGVPQVSQSVAQDLVKDIKLKKNAKHLNCAFIITEDKGYDLRSRLKHLS